MWWDLVYTGGESSLCIIYSHFNEMENTFENQEIVAKAMVENMTLEQLKQSVYSEYLDLMENWDSLFELNVESLVVINKRRTE